MLSAVVCAKELNDQVRNQTNIKVLNVIEILLPCISSELFTIKKNYTIVAKSEYTYGKWP